MHCHATFRIDKIAWNYGKTANIIEQTAVYHTVNGDPSFHTSKTETRSQAVARIADRTAKIVWVT